MPSRSLPAALTLRAKIVLACHPRMVGIVESFLTREQDKESRRLPYGSGELKVEKIFACDAEYDTMADVPDEVNPLVHSFEKVHTAEEYQGGRKAVDGSDEMASHGEALDELVASFRSLREPRR